MNDSDDSVDRVTSLLINIPKINCLWIVGSAVNYPDQCNDIDLLAGFSSGTFADKSNDIIKVIHSKIENAKCITSDDAIRFIINDKTFSVALCFLPQLFNQLKQYINGISIEGQHRPWATGYWIPEALCGDLVCSKVLYDNNDSAIKINNLLNEYSSRMRKAIISSCFTEVNTKLRRIHNLSHQSIEYAILRSDIAVALIRMSFAKSRIYLRGFSHIDRQLDLLSKDGLYLYTLAQRVARESQIPIQEITEFLKGVEKDEKTINGRN